MRCVKILSAAALLLSLAITALIAVARESWPEAPPDVKARLASYDAHEQELLKKLKPEMEEWAKKGKPYIPWASKPEDLPQASIPAFPGAEGGGIYSFGGRGGKVYVVTSLEDSGPGTLREACEAAGPRIVVFNVAGIIHLKMPIFIEAPYITIAGQSAPGDGICIADQGIIDNAHDVVIRYIRLRRGVTDIYNRHGGHYGNPVGNIVLDHISASWGNDQNIDTYRHMYLAPGEKTEQKLPTVNVTIQWCISSEGLNTWNHAFGGDWGGRNTGFHHNLMASNAGRNPSIAMSYDFNFVNNVLFNWRHRTLDGGDQNSKVNVINNYFKPGPVTAGALRYRIAKVDGRSPTKGAPQEYGRWYVDGNIVDGNAKVTADNWDGGLQFSPPGAAAESTDVQAPGEMVKKLIAEVRVKEPFPMPPIRIESAQDAYQAVLGHAGASLPRRDAVDKRIVEEVRTGNTPLMGQSIPIQPMDGLAKNNIGVAGDGIITDISQVGGYPEYKGQPFVYTQHDGIPDWWKKKYNLDVNDPDLATKDSSDDGYTNIEKYLNGIDPTRPLDFKDPKNNRNMILPEKLFGPDWDKATDKPADTTDKTDARPPKADSKSSDVKPTNSKSDSKSDADKDAAYTQTIEKRTKDILVLLDEKDAAKLAKVHDAIMAQYRALNDWQNNKGEEPARKALHDAFIAKLNAELKPGDVEKVKDKMVYGKVQFTYNGYLSINHNLTEEDKAKILDFLKQAREEAMDGVNTKEKDNIFNRYKGKINNYLSAVGHNVTKEVKDSKESTDKPKDEREKAAPAASPLN